MHASAKCGIHACREGDRIVAEFFPHSIHRLQRLAPSLRVPFVQQPRLAFRRFQRLRINTQQADGSAFPIVMKQIAGGAGQLGIDLRSVIQRARAGEGGEIRVAQLDLNRPRVAADDRADARATISDSRTSIASSAAASAVSTENVCSWLMDFGSPPSPISPSNQPPASSPRAFPASARPHCPKRSSRNVASSARQIADFADAAGMQIALRHFADARNLAHIERRQKPRFFACG